MLLDLVSPWAAAVEAGDSARACAAFRRRHVAVLEALRRQRAPLADAIPLATDPIQLARLVRRTADAGLQQRLRDALAAAAQLGATAAATAVLLAGDDSGDTMEPLPYPEGMVALFVERAAADDDLIVAAARGLVALTRWSVADSASPLRAAPRDPWDRWMVARAIPLSEWLYTEGVGLHLAQALLPKLPLHRLLGTSRGAFHRLREREKSLRASLAVDLDRAGIDLVVRWLLPEAARALQPPAGRTAQPSGELALPPHAGRYLAWRMTAERIARMGLPEAMRATEK